MELIVDKESMHKVIQRIETQIQKRGYKKSDLANNLGWSPSKISKIFSLDQKLTVDDLIAIGIELRCNPALFLLGEEEINMRIEGKTLHDIFSHVRNNDGYCGDFLEKVKNEIPLIMRVYLDLDDETTEVKVKVRKKGINRNQISGVVPGSLPRVVINDNSVGSLYGKEITVGYWFMEDLSGVYLAINYNSDESNPANEFESRKTILNRTLFFRGLLGESSKRCNYENFGKKDDPKSQRYEDGMIKVISYQFDNLPKEEDLKADLIRFYDDYKKLLKVSVSRVKRNYLCHNSVVDTKELAQSLENLQSDGEINWEKTIKRGPQRSLYNALERENYQCEIDRTHETFIQEKNGKQYMEAIHLIPLSANDDFKYSLRVEANVCCLCPNCSAKLRYSSNEEKQDLLMMLYLKHKEGLKASGIEITPMQLLKYYGIS